MSELQIQMIISNESTWRKHILLQLDKLTEDSISNKIDIATLKVKVAFFGSLFGAGAGLVTAIVAKYL